MRPAAPRTTMYFNIRPGTAGDGTVYARHDHCLPRRAMKQYKMREGCFALDYARGRLFACIAPARLLAQYVVTQAGYLVLST